MALPEVRLLISVVGRTPLYPKALRWLPLIRLNDMPHQFWGRP